MNRPKGTKKGYIDPSSQVPESGIFNPMDYIDQANYKLNRRGQAQYEEDLAQIEYLAQMRQQQFALEYQDPSAEAERMRAAGLNPDLLGLSGASAPSGPAGTEGAKLSQLPTNVQNTQSILGIIESVTSITKNFATGGLQLSNMFMQNLQTEATTMNSLLQLQDTSALRGVSLSDFPLSRRLRRKLDALPYSPEQSQINHNKKFSTLYDSEVSRMESQAKHWSHVLNPLYNPSGSYDSIGLTTEFGTPEQWSKIWKPLADFAYKQFGHSAAAGFSEAKNKDEYFNSSDNEGNSLGSLQGSYEVATYKESTDQQEFMNSLRGPIRQVAKNLKKEADNGSSWANFALIALYFVSQVSFSRSSGSKGSSTSFGIGK